MGVGDWGKGKGIERRYREWGQEIEGGESEDEKKTNMGVAEKKRKGKGKIERVEREL